MNKQLSLNKSVAYRKKNEVYVFYYDFNYIFFTGNAAILIDKLLEISNGKGSFQELPETFLEYLKSKRILLEV